MSGMDATRYRDVYSGAVVWAVLVSVDIVKVEREYETEQGGKGEIIQNPNMVAAKLWHVIRTPTPISCILDLLPSSMLFKPATIACEDKFYQGYVLSPPSP